MKKKLQITFCGAPNVGKSTLLNTLLGYKLTICSPKPQTTRDNITGVITNGDTQLIFIDTPGIFKPKNSQLEKQIIKEAWKGLCGSDLICLIIDGTKGFDIASKIITEKTKNNNIPVICVINKSDLMNMEQKILLANNIWNSGRFIDIFSLSAKKNKGCDKLLDYFFQNAKIGEWIFNEDDITDKDNNFITSEFVREQLFIILQKELPYMLDCETEFFEETNDLINLSVVVNIKKQNYKKIILGKNGNNLKNIIKKASINLEKFFQKKVILKIFVRYIKNRNY